VLYKDYIVVKEVRGSGSVSRQSTWNFCQAPWQVCPF